MTRNEQSTQYLAERWRYDAAAQNLRPNLIKRGALKSVHKDLLPGKVPHACVFAFMRISAVRRRGVQVADNSVVCFTCRGKSCKPTAHEDLHLQRPAVH